MLSPYMLIWAACLSASTVMWAIEVFIASWMPRKRTRAAVLVLLVAATVTATFIAFIATQISYASSPWDVTYSFVTLPAWMPNLSPWAAGVTAIVALAVVMYLKREWLVKGSWRPALKTGVTMCAILIAGAGGVALFARTVGDASASYRTPPQLFAFANQDVTSLDVDLVADNKGTSVAFLDTGYHVDVHLTGIPGSRAQFLLVGEGYFATSPFSSSTAIEVPPSPSLWGSSSGNDCNLSGVGESDAFTYIAGDRHLLGSVVFDGSGNAAASVQFGSHVATFNYAGDVSQVHLPELHLSELGGDSTTCFIAAAPYSGVWKSPATYTGSVSLANPDLLPGNVLEQVGDPTPADSSNTGPTILGSKDLTFALKATAPEATNRSGYEILPFYVISGPEVETFKNTLSFVSALLLGVALAALVELLRSWPAPPRPPRSAPRGSRPRRPRPSEVTLVRRRRRTRS
ncbi:hypothetical protein [Subtercola vilae]|uniref:hypothetical protein n=1 Tax=Subtercola vilae TaxID=2056433 RepID=UPI0010A9CD2B|nr:hypothetical protein [Subtercola vilae]